jgi:hypothetical protein
MRRSLLLMFGTQSVRCVPPAQLQAQDRPVASLNHDPALGSQLTFSDAALNAGSDHHQVSLFAQAMNQTEMASSLYDRISNVKRSYLCKAPSIRTACPTLVDRETNSIPDLTIPANARWLFEGPSYMMELFLTLSSANGGCTAHGDEPMLRKASEAQRPEVCHLPNGARLYHSGSKASTEGIIDVETWTHGFFMDYHGSEYDAEHAAAAKEGREPDAAKMRDAQGRDMCLPKTLSYGCCDVANGASGQCCATPPRETGFAGYMNCIDELGHVGTFRAAIGVKTTVVVPWHLLKPAEPPSGSFVFTNERAVERDCTTGLQDEGVDSHGFHVWGYLSVYDGYTPSIAEAATATRSRR